MWLINSSVGRKVVMSITGLALILFLTFHMSMNLAVVFSAEAYNWICELLGANWYALVATAGLAGLAVLHIVYAIWLTLQNRAARGSERYAVSAKPKNVEWASQNMFVLGLIVLVGLGLHLAHFWYKMQFAEIMGLHSVALGDATVTPTEGATFIQYYFSQPLYVVIYLVWFAAIWLHLTHGFWSAIQTIGVTNKVWFNRWKVIGNICVTLLMAGFAFVVIFMYVKSLI